MAPICMNTGRAEIADQWSAQGSYIQVTLYNTTIQTGGANPSAVASAFCLAIH